MRVIAAAFRFEGTRKADKPADFPLEPATIGDLIENGRGLVATCEVCLHSARIDLPDLAARYGCDHSCLEQALRPVLQCSVCKSTEATVQEIEPHRHGAERPKVKTSIPGYV